jgi:phenylacetate-coenzyme A ligase PaaK-like adenylate-forming protein
MGTPQETRRNPSNSGQAASHTVRILVAHAKKYSPYYSEVLKEINPASFTLNQLPTLTKKTMMENFPHFLTDRQINQADVEQFMSEPSRLGQWYLGKYAVSHTSGTEGLKYPSGGAADSPAAPF